MGSRKRIHRRSFYGTALAEETRKEKRYNELRHQRRLSVSKEVDNQTSPKWEPRDCLTERTYSICFPFDYHPSRKRSNSLPNPTMLNIMVTKMENERAANGISRPRSASFDPTAKLYTAAAENDTSELERVLDSGKANPNRLFLSGIAPLHIAAAEGHLESIKILVRYKADINILDLEGCSPLEFAIRGAHFDCASFLIKQGAETKKIVHGLH